MILAEKTNFTITRMVRLLEVSRSGYYVWVDRKPSGRMIRREGIEQKVAWFHGVSDEVYGSPRILADLRADGETISRKTVAKTMQRLGLVGICPKKWKTTTIIDHADAYPVDAVKREWDTGALNQVWVGDITYLRTWEGWVYLATVIDAHSRRVIGWAIAAHMRIEDALMMAMTLRGERPAHVIFHSDRGTQYASAQITAFAIKNGITRSMGLTGICWDNAMAESFFATLKTEFYYRRVWPTRDRATREVGTWIEDRYNAGADTPQSGKSAQSTSNCNTPQRPRKFNSPLNPCPLTGGKATAEAVSMLEAAPMSAVDEPARQAFLALALYDEGRYGDALRTALLALVPTLESYQRSLRGYAGELPSTESDSSPRVTPLVS
ncbi:IS3 family transposase [Cryobacterium sp. Hz9]|uniref:IS3 family transposase n=1 Tax=Cryobacterium sp. Hz9 TaxID=1259167 RepID=UPI00106D629E|nr:IS3 family transposase [Cryobacterium sp. Hz9]TFB66146.1 IS3 family transposase [Cryobacterium sp. Hz9]